jgi:NAD(P)H-hydrate epimerase
MQSPTIDEDFVARQIPARKRDSHKGVNGVACIVGGSRIYHGAPFLSAIAALRTGVDLVYLAVPNVISTAIRALSPDLIVIPLPDSKLTRGNVSKLKKWMHNADCIGIGPGLGPQSKNDVANCIRSLKDKTRSMVLDADALKPEILELAKEVKLVVTPHAGEFERLFGEELPPSLDGRVEMVHKQAEKHLLTILLKGPTDIISDGEKVSLNQTHSPSMTVGGTGDVLTGVTTALLAKKIQPFEAASCAAYINGSAGIEATDQFGLHITPSDVVNNIANVMKRFDRIE